MSRLIDADALMADLEKWLKQIDPTHPSEDNAIPPMEDIIVSTLMTIEEQPTIEPQRWIPVTEALPEDGLYIVTTSKGQVQVHVFSHNGNSEEYWMRCNKAWMPLPEPYKESEE